MGDGSPEKDSDERTDLSLPPSVPVVIRSPLNDSHRTFSSLTVRGTAPRHCRIELYDWLHPVCVTTADKDGRWKADLEHLENGAHVLTARVMDGSGGVLATSTPITVTIEVPHRGHGSPKVRQFGRARDIFRSTAVIAVLIFLLVLFAAVLAWMVIHRHHGALPTTAIVKVRSSSLFTDITFARALDGIAPTSRTKPNLVSHLDVERTALINLGSSRARLPRGWRCCHSRARSRHMWPAARCPASHAPGSEG